MASIGSRGLVDDGSSNLTVTGVTSLTSLNTVNLVTSSAASFGLLSTIRNQLIGQNLGSPNTFVQINQWLTGSAITAGVTPTPSSSMTVNLAGWHYTSVSLSFSGSTGVYTFSLFQNNIQHENCQRQTTIGSGQSFPVGITLADLNWYNVGDTLDVRVQSTNAGANFQLNNGNFIIFRVLG